MNNKIKKEISRTELADVLEEIAGFLRQGTFELDDHRWPVPAELDVKLKHKEKKGRIKTQIEWHWSTLDEYTEADREALEKWQKSFKQAKKRLGRTFKAMQKAVNAGQLPTDEELAAFVADSNLMDEVADPEWHAALEEYNDHLANLQKAVANEQLDAVAHELRDLGVRMKECHREFK